MTQRTEEEIRILKELGYDPDDPSYTVQMLGNAGVPTVTVTETAPDIIEVDITDLKHALQEAITALQRVLDLIK
jgi:hypothetical protein